jgi:signal transduction histidine kinase
MNYEDKRLEALNSYEILDTNPEIEFDNITFLASTLCNTPISTITLIDKYRQWYKSKIGIEATESPRENSFCSLAIEKSSETIVVERLMEDEDFRKVGLMNGLTDSGFYAGVPIKENGTGLILGTLCVIDYKNNSLTESQIKSLEILAEQTSKLFEMRKRFKKLTKNNEYLNLRYSELEKFAGVISHDMKSPLNNIISLINLLKDDVDHKLGTDSVEYIDHIEECSIQLKNYIDGLLNFYKNDNIDFTQKNELNLSSLINEIKLMQKDFTNVNVNYQSDYDTININKYALIQILHNLIGNGIKYNDKEIVEIKIDFSENANYYIIKVTDNGIGIETKDFLEIYESFKILNVKDRYGNYGTGLGLSTVKKIVDKLNGRIEITSELKKGTTFTLFLAK